MPINNEHVQKLMRIVFLLLCLLIIGCDSSSQDAFDRNFKLHNEEIQKGYVEQLQKEGIPHKILSDGSIAYSSKDEGKFSEIRIRYLHESFEPSACYFDKDRERHFLDALEKENIKYEIKEKNLGMCITWSKEDDEQVKRIREELFKPAVWFSSIDSERKFLERLEKENIAYSISEVDGNREIYWSKEDDAKARAIFHEPSNSSPCENPKENVKEEKIYPDGSKSTVGTDFLQIPFNPHMCYFDEERLKKFLGSLEKENIQYEIKTTKLNLAKCVVWSSKDDYHVKQMARRMFNPSGWFGDLEREKNFLEKMEEARIEYMMYEEEGDRRISWSKEDESRVDEVYDSLARE